jgi:hypothetical protein
MTLRALLVLAPVALVAACGHPGSVRLEGHWKGVRVDGPTGDALTRATEFATQTELDMRGDRITVTFPNQDPQSGRYRVLDETKQAVVIVTDKDGPNDKQTFSFVDEKTIKWLVLEGKSITFAKQ